MKPLAADSAGIRAAAEALHAGRLVAFPTETVYGLGADAASADAVAAIYRLKGRPADHPLIVHVSAAARARRWARWSATAQVLADAFWPGPLTMILPRLPDAPAWACGGQPSIGLRVPSHPVAQALLVEFERLGGLGVAAPSANRFGRVSPTRAAHVVDDLGDDAPMVLDGGAAEVGLESTIVDLSREQPALLRPGGLGVATIEAVLGVRLSAPGADAPRASGTLVAHYAPRTPIVLCAAAQIDERLAMLEARGLRCVVWSRTRPASSVAAWEPASDDDRVFAHSLYDTLRRLDRAGFHRIVIEQPPGSVAWAAVSDRLNRAAVGAPAQDP